MIGLFILQTSHARKPTIRSGHCTCQRRSATTIQLACSRVPGSEMVVESRSVKRKSCASYFRFARFNTFPLYYLRAWHRLLYNRKYICVLSRIHRSRDFVTVSARFISETLHVMLSSRDRVAKETNFGKQLVKKWLTLRA